MLDTAGTALPGVTVQAIGSTPGEPRLEVTDLEGRYPIAELSPHTYTVLFTLPGFRSVVRDGADAAEPIDLARNSLTVSERLYGVAAVDGALLVRTGRELIRIGLGSAPHP